MTIKEVLWIDEEQDAFDSFGDFLSECFGDEAEVVPTPPKERLDDMVRLVSSHEELAGLIVDQRLKSTGVASYTGIELIDTLRQHFPKLPVYILTNHCDDIGSSDYQVEYVLEKDKLYEKDYLHAIQARVRRHMSVYDDILSERQLRYEKLLRSSLERDLDDGERAELKELDVLRTKTILADEIQLGEGLKKALDKAQEVLKEIQRDREKDAGGGHNEAE